MHYLIPLAVVLLALGCESTLHDPGEYHRHSMSGLREDPRDAEMLWFEVKADSRR